MEHATQQHHQHAGNEKAALEALLASEKQQLLLQQQQQQQPAAAPAPSLSYTIPAIWSRLSFSDVLWLGAFFRGLLVLYAVWQDANYAVKYTDIDYFVYSDATGFLVRPDTPAPGPLARKLQGLLGVQIGTPYDRATYRYTPLLAILLIPNEFTHPLFGKLLFCGADLLVGCLLYHILTVIGKTDPRKAKLYVGASWLLNPFVINMSTRGSSDTLLGVLVLGSLALAESQWWIASAALFGASVHFKIYPFIYGASVLARLAREEEKLINWKQIQFGIVSFASFMMLNVFMFSIWGHPFVEHTYLYHLTRLDHRHNFSYHFYPIYLTFDLPKASASLFTLVSKVMSSTFIPQMGLSALAGILLGDSTNLSYAWFIQTLIFVAFNRVCTSQYFLWFIWFIPLVIPNLEFGGRTCNKKRQFFLAVVCFASRIVTHIIWVAKGYNLEFLGKPEFVELWVAGILLFASNVGCVYVLLDAFSH